MYKVKAVFEYTSEHDDDLTFSLGQIITVIEEEDAEWLVGEYTDDAGQHHEGMFPRNFVEKYEPVAPPRPARARKRDSELPVGASAVASTVAADEHASSPPPPPPAAIPAPVPDSPKEALQPIEEPEPVIDEPTQESEPEETPQPLPVKAASPPASPTASAPPLPKPVEPTSPVARAVVPKAAEPAGSPPAASSKHSPPPVSEKPSSFRDRIAAFNKAAAPPITPFKPSGLAVGGGSSNFIKKPFVAPPPSRHAFIPPTRDVPTARVYRRDEDPEMKERLSESQENAEKAGLAAGPSAGGGNGNGDDDDEEPKPMMSLKERMARLQKEQLEQAQRHSEAASKKEKPKRPPKKRIESYEPSPTTSNAAAEDPFGAGQVPPLERKSTSDIVGRQSIDSSRAPNPPRRKASKDTTGPDAQDGNDADMSGAGDTTEGQEEEDEHTERDDSDEISRRPSRTIPIIVPVVERRSVDQSRDVVEEEDEDEDGEETAPSAAKAAPAPIEEEDAAGEDDEAAEESDPEARRKEELRARMAKMSGGMGMMGMRGMQGMFGGPPPMPPKKKTASTSEPRTSESTEDASPAQPAPPVPTMMALPGMVPRRPTVAEDEQDEDEEEEVAAPAAKEAPQSPTLLSRGAPPPVPSGRPVPPPPPAAAANIKSPSEGSASDDELSEGQARDPLETPRAELTQAQFAPPPPPPPPPASAPRAPPPIPIPTSPRAASSGQFGGDEASPASPTSPQSKRASRLPPQIPSMPPVPPPTQTRAPPPPPPGTLSRQSTADSRVPLSPVQTGSHGDEEEEEVTEYEGDYDTDIANPVSHKKSLQSHARDSSLEDNASLKSPVSDKAPSFPPPIPSAARAPPPIPSQPPPAPSLPSSHPPPPPPPPPSAADKRRSMDVPRAPPPPPPPSAPAPASAAPSSDDYDPFAYVSQPSFMSDAYTPPDLSLSMAAAAGRGVGGQHPQAPPPPPPPPQVSAASFGGRSARQSMDLSSRGAAAGGRRSIDVARPSMETGFVANELDLAPNSGWWLQANGLPPQLQGRKDIFFESEESQVARGQKVITNRDLYILYQDYSQTVINVQFDPSNAADAELEQRHEAPPRPLREHQFEEAYNRFGSNIANAVLAKKDTVVGDGTPQGLIAELLKPFPDALSPVGTRAYGALVYANMANASTTLMDLIRPGDIMTLRNTKFQGKHGAMHAKYSMEVGKPDHVAVVSEWDGTKKKVRAWEQGRESRKVKLESFKLDDLRSGEVRIWRVMPRKWIGWEDSSGQK